MRKNTTLAPLSYLLGMAKRIFRRSTSQSNVDAAQMSVAEERDALSRRKAVRTVDHAEDRYCIIADIHSNQQALRAVLTAADELGVQSFVCLGDVVGYNANPNECVALLREREIPTVLGDHDAVACGIEEPWGFDPIALAAALWTRERLSPENKEWLRQLPDVIHFNTFLAAHGSPADRNCYLYTWEDVLPHLSVLSEGNRSVCFFGHTHCPGILSSDGMYTVDDDSTFQVGPNKSFFVNPGSGGQPQDGDPRAAFAVYDSRNRELQLLRVEYDVKLAAKQIMDAGLPVFLAERLYLGR